MPKKYLCLDDPLYSYVCQNRSHANDPLLAALRKETEALGDDARMQISEEQGSFLSIITASISAESAIEVGTFTGFSSLCIARRLGSGGRLICLDASEEWTGVARRYWQQAGVSDRIELRLGAALDSLAGLEPGLTFDLAFIDADKTEYDAYYELLLPRMRTGGLILFDNMLWGGGVVDAVIEDESCRAINALNRKLANDPRIECVLLPVADGIQMCRKR